MDGNHRKALNEAKVSMSPVQTTFVVASADSAASGGSDGTKRKRQITPVQVPVEKEACGVVPQPVLTPEDLKRICLSSTRLEQWCYMPFFASIVTGCFIRVSMEDGSTEPSHCIAEIVSVMETDQVYQLESKRTNLGFKLRHAGIDNIVTLKSASDKEFTIVEFMQWELAMLFAGLRVPTLDKIARKEKSLKEALDRTLTPREFNFLVAQKNRFRAVPLNLAKKKIQLHIEQNAARSRGDASRVKQIQEEMKMLNKGTEAKDQPQSSDDDLLNLFLPVVKSIRAPPPKAQTDHDQGRDFFTRTKTRPIMVTTFKNESVRKAIYDELDRRYGCGSTEEEK